MDTKYTDLERARLGEEVTISGRRLTVTTDGIELARLKKEELVLLHERGEITQERMDGLQAAVRLVLGRCGSLATHDGLPCRGRARTGMLLCPSHGGRLPTVLARSERLLAAIRLPALEWLAREIDRADSDPCHECGYPRQGLKERKYIASLVWRLLDRAGLPPTKKLEVATTGDRDVTLDGWTDVEKSELASYLRAAKRLKEQVESRLLREQAEKNLAIPGTVIPERVIEAARGALGPRPAESELDPLDT